MAYFPAFLNLDNFKILIIGGGNIAYEKCSHLVDFSTNISIIAMDFNQDMKDIIKEYNLSYDQREYKVGDIKGFNIVITAVDDMELQKEIFFESKQYPNCLCNSVDNQKYCDFIFPSYVKKDSLTIAISTSGTSPAFAKHLRIYLSKLIPSSVDEFLQEMKGYRKTMPKGKDRMKFLEEKAKQYISTWRIK